MPTATALTFVQQSHTEECQEFLSAFRQQRRLSSDGFSENSKQGDFMTSTLADMANLGRHIHEHRQRLLTMIEWRLDPRLRVRVCADDVLQDAFRRAHLEWSDFLAEKTQEFRSVENPDAKSLPGDSLSVTNGSSGGLPVYAWLRRHAKDALIEAWRKHSRELRDVRNEMPLPDSSALHLGMGLLGRDPGPATSLRRDEVCELVREALQELKEIDREVLLMRMTEDMSHPEIAAALNISVDAAWARYGRALERFRKIWNERHPDFGSLP